MPKMSETRSDLGKKRVLRVEVQAACYHKLVAAAARKGYKSATDYLTHLAEESTLSVSPAQVLLKEAREAYKRGDFEVANRLQQQINQFSA